MNNKSSIFTSSEATRVNISLLVFTSEIKSDLSLMNDKVRFSISLLLENCNNLVYTNASAFRMETQLFP